ncbi:MAG TPA: serine/threonine-protein kinase [Anaerolineae bacterium]|nr:serine/threonine-protein kinase [Anaerolineae bacterium]
MEDGLVGRRLANYRIERLLGQGGMAQVYYGIDESLHRPVAIKAIDSRWGHRETYIQRLIQEARSMATWRHEHILQVYYAGQEEYLYYFAMEYIDGLNLEQSLTEYGARGQLAPQDDVLNIGEAVASALDYAHEKGVVHRDIKPSNVMIAKDGRVVLADFGLAMDQQRGSLGETFGSPHYIAPEQARSSAAAVAQSDLYALGVILYEMLTGVVPFDDPSPMSIALMHLTDAPPSPRQLNPRLNEATEEVLLKALSKEPEDRYPSGEALMEALREALAEGEMEPEVPTELPPMPTAVSTPYARPVSQMSIVDLVMLQAEAGVDSFSNLPKVATSNSVMREELPRLPASVVTPDQGQKRQQRFIYGALVGLVLVALCGVVWFILNPDLFIQVVDPTPTSTPTTAPTRQQIVDVSSPTVTASATPIPVPKITRLTPTNTPTLTPSPSPTATPVPPTRTPTPTKVTTPTATPTATPVTEGQQVLLLYNDYSFYLLNLSEDIITPNLLVLEAIDNSTGDGTNYLFPGNQWSRFFPQIDPGYCGGIEPVESPAFRLLRPTQCTGFNAIVTPGTDNELVFWIARENVDQFRALWRGREVGRCDSQVSVCEIFLPE